MKLLNSPKLRSVVFGASGGLLGWFLAELFYGAPESSGDAMATGSLVGIGIGALLGAAEGLAIQSRRLATRGVSIGLLVGLIGGAAGAVFGQFTYGMLTPESGSSTTGTSEVVSQATVFSSEVRKRLREAGAREGEIEIALSWENKNDLDLHVVDPSGEEIYFEHKVSRSGGELDVDRNAGCGGNVTSHPIEHVVWDYDHAPEGEYTVFVNHYAICTSIDPTSFRIEIKTGEKASDLIKGSIRDGDSKLRVTSFIFHQPRPELVQAGDDEQSAGPLIPRILGWALFGLILGSVEGLRRQSKVALRNATIGGVIGGAIGGLIFHIIAYVQIGDLWSRLIGFVILGACIGLWIVIVEQALSAVLAIRNGRFEGRQIFLDRPEMRLGRSDALEVYLGGDPGIAAHHATVRTDGTHHLLEPVDGLVHVNGEDSSSRVLADGDTISIGSTRLLYKRRRGLRSESLETTASQSVPVKSAPPPPPPKRRSELADSARPKTATQGQSEPLPPQAKSEIKSTTGKPPPPPPKRK